MEELSFVLALPLSTAVSRLYPFVVVVVMIKLTYVIPYSPFGSNK